MSFQLGALWTYSGVIKKMLLLSTLTISFSHDPHHYFWLMVFYRKFNLLAMVYAMFGCAVIFVRETLKDIISTKGERVFGINSVPIVWGIRGAKLIIYLACFYWNSTTIRVCDIGQKLDSQDFFYWISSFHFLVFIQTVNF